MRKAAALVGTRAARATRLAGRSAPLSLSLPALLVLAVWLALFNQLNGFPLIDIDEGAFSEATREMLARGDYVTTYLNGQPRFDEPILTCWLQALSVLLFGPREFAFRLPSALAAVGWAVAILLFTRQQSDRRTAYVAALIAVTSAGVCVIGRAATADALLNLFLALAMFDIYRYLEQPLKRFRRRAFLWIALGVLTKGMVALLIPFAVSAMAFGLHGKWREWRQAVLDPAGWGILLAVAAPWYAIEYVRHGDAFIAGDFMHDDVEHFIAPLQGQGGNALYYMPVLLLLLLPYSGLFLRILPAVRQLRARPLDTFLWCWFLFVLVLFSLAADKLPHSLWYGMTPLFVLMAMRRGLLQSRLLAFAPPTLLLAAVVLLPAALQYFGAAIGDPYLREALTRREAFGIGYRVAAPTALLACLALAMMPRYQVWQKLVGAGVLCAGTVGGLVLPALGELRQGPVKEAALFARDAGLLVRTWHFNVPSFSVYRGKITESAATPRPGEVLLTRSSTLAGLGGFDVLYRKGGVMLVRLAP